MTMVHEDLDLEVIWREALECEVDHEDLQAAGEDPPFPDCDGPAVGVLSYCNIELNSCAAVLIWIEWIGPYLAERGDPWVCEVCGEDCARTLWW